MRFFKKKAKPELVELIDLKTLTINHDFDLDSYKNGSNTTLNNCKFWQEFTTNYSKDWLGNTFGLYENHLAGYEAALGKPAFIFKSEHNWSGWPVKVSENEHLLLLSAKGGGSTFEISGPGCNQWPPVVSEEAQKMILRVIMSIDKEMALPIRREMEARIAKSYTDDMEP